MRNFYTYTGPGGQRLHGYQRKYQKSVLRKRGFVTKGAAESHLRQAMSDIDATARGEVRVKPTTLQDALTLYTRKLDVRGREKSSQYRWNTVTWKGICEEFIERCGAASLVREVNETDLREFYQVLCFRTSRSTAATYIGCVYSMIKCAQSSRPDLANWRRPKLTIKQQNEYERRVVDPQEYSALVNTLLSPPLARSHRAERKALWREAGDAVQILRLTGGRLNEVLRLKVDQLNFTKRAVRLYATKTENERDVPMTSGLYRLLQNRLREGLMLDGFVFPRAATETFDNAVARACTQAATHAKLAYGRENGFTLHSLRHTFITDLLLKTKDIAGTMELSGHKTLGSFSTYLHLLDTGFTNAALALESVDPFVIPSEGLKEHQGQEGMANEAANVLQLKQVAVQ
jgi:integrase